MSETVILIDAQGTPELRTLAADLARERLTVRELLEVGPVLLGLVRGSPTVVVCDSTGAAGFDVVRALVASEVRGQFPLLVLTGPDDLIGRVVAFELGADDVVSRPWSTREVALRLRALLRRSTARPPEDIIRYGTLVVDSARDRAESAGRDLNLSVLEGRLLLVLAARKGAQVSREEIEGELWGSQATGARALDTVVKRLRRKLSRTGLLLSTIRGAGFRLDLADEPADSRT